jgi:hypothetical protein
LGEQEGKLMRVECNRHVQVYLSPEEKAEFGRQLARNAADLETLEDRKKQVASEFKAKIDAANAEIFKTARLLNNGYEYRDVKCDVQYDTPRKGLKRIVRMDTGEVVEEIPMTADELQQVLDFGIEKTIESAAEVPPAPAPESSLLIDPDPAPEPEAPPSPQEMPESLSEPVRVVGSGKGWSAEIIIFETTAGFEAEASMTLGQDGPAAADGGTPHGSEADSREDAASRLHRLAQRHYSEARGSAKKALRELMAWAAERMPKREREASAGEE